MANPPPLFPFTIVHASPSAQVMIFNVIPDRPFVLRRRLEEFGTHAEHRRLRHVREKRAPASDDKNTSWKSPINVGYPRKREQREQWWLRKLRWVTQSLSSTAATAAAAVFYPTPPAAAATATAVVSAANWGSGAWLWGISTTVSSW
jgi:hypothetical protein